MSDIEQEGQQPEAERPDYLAAKFESVEAQARAYADAEREMNRLRADMDRKEREFTEALSALGEQERERSIPAWNPSADPTIAAYNRALEEGDGATALSIQMQLQQAQLQQAFQQFEERMTPQMQQATSADRELALRMAEQQVAAGFGDRWGEIAPKVSERLAQNRGVLDQAPVSVESYAAILTEQARLVEYDRLTALEAQREQERQAKLAAQTLSGSVSRTPTSTPEKDQEWQQIATAPSRGTWDSVVGRG